VGLRPAVAAAEMYAEMSVCNAEVSVEIDTEINTQMRRGGRADARRWTRRCPRRCEEESRWPSDSRAVQGGAGRCKTAHRGLVCAASRAPTRHTSRRTGYRYL